MVVVIVSTIIVSVMGYYVHQTRHLAKENQARLSESIAVRKDLVHGFRAANRRLCREIENLKDGFRLQAVRQYRMLPQTLKLLHIRDNGDIRRAALEDKADTLRRYAARKDGCTKVP